MTMDLATLGVKVDASEADSAGIKLEALADKGGKAETAAKKLTSATSTLDKQMKSLLGQIRDNTAATAASIQAQEQAARTARDEAAARARASEQARLQAKAQRETEAAAEAEANAVMRLRSSIDPLAVAQERVNAELREAQILFEAGTLSANDYARAQQVLGMRATDLAQRQDAVNARLAGTAKAAKLSTTEALNLSRQMADVGVTAAMGMNPLMILIQQGPQIADIMKTSGLGFRGLAREIGLMTGILREVPVANAAVAASAVTAAAAESSLAAATAANSRAAAGAAAAAGTVAAGNTAIATTATAAATAQAVALAPLAIVLAGVAAVVGTIAVGFAVAANEMEDGLGNVQKELGLTEKQMKRLKDEGVDTGVTMGDAFLGFYDTVKDIIVEAFGPQIDAIKQKFGEWYEAVVTGAKNAIRALIGGFIGAYYAIRDTWALLPRAIGDLAVQAANATIGAVESMINGVSSRINELINLANAGAEKLGMGKVLGNIGTASLGRVGNPYAGGATAAADAATRGWNRGNAEGGAMVDRFGARWEANTQERWEKRVREGAGDGDKAKKEREKKAPKPKKSEEEKDYESAINSAEDYVKSLKEETEAIGKNAIETKRLASARAAAEITQAAAKIGTQAAIENAARLTAEIDKQQKAWEEATANEALRKLTEELRDQADALDFETKLIGANAEERARANAQREIDLKLRQLERDGIKITTDLIEKETAAVLAHAVVKGRATDAAEAANRTAVAMRDVANSVREATEGFGDMFGKAGEGFSNLLNTMLDFDARQAESRAKLIELQNEYNNGQMSETEYAFERGRVNADIAREQQGHYGAMIGAAKGFFREGSTGWKVLEGAERAYRIFQFGMQIRSMLMDKVETASSVSNSGIRAAADGVAAVAKAIASLPFPLNLMAGAATAAALVAFGVKMVGGGGKGGGKSTGNMGGDGSTDNATSSASFNNYNVTRQSAPAYSSGGAGVATRSAAGGSNTSLRVVVENAPPGFYLEQKSISADEVRLIARNEVNENAPKVVARDMANSNSPTSKAMKSNFEVTPRR